MRIAMMAITTRSSMSVNARRVLVFNMMFTSGMECVFSGWSCAQPRRKASESLEVTAQKRPST